VAVSPGASLAEPGGQKWGSAIHNITTQNQSLSMLGIVFDVAGGGEQSVGSQLALEMDGQKENMRRRQNWLLHQDGSGEFSQCGTTTATNVVQLATGADMTQYEVDQEIGIHNRSTGALATGSTAGQPLKITEVDLVNEQLTVKKHDNTTASMTTSASHGVYGFGEQGLQCNGFGVFVSETNPDNWGGSGNDQYGGIDKSLTPNAFWKGKQIDGGNSIFNIQEHIQPAHREVRLRAGQAGGNHRRMICFLREGNWHALYNQLQKDVRFSGNITKMVRGGWEAMTYDRTFFVLDDDAPVTKARWVDPDNTYRYVMRMPWFDDKTGSIWTQLTDAINGRPVESYRANILTRQQMFTTTNLTAIEVNNLNASN